MQSRDDIFKTLQATMCELFELDAEQVTLDANLYQDLDIDSIDAVDLVIKIREITGKKIKAEDFKNVRTVNDIIDAVEALQQA